MLCMARSTEQLKGSAGCATKGPRYFLCASITSSSQKQARLAQWIHEQHYVPNSFRGMCMFPGLFKRHNTDPYILTMKTSATSATCQRHRWFRRQTISKTPHWDSHNKADGAATSAKGVHLQRRSPRQGHRCATATRVAIATPRRA